uniref:hypothetical protein n=1 Tax=Prevotella heparinolytica TaxID=28113 RepID=UPI0035A16A8E
YTNVLLFSDTAAYLLYKSNVAQEHHPLSQTQASGFSDTSACQLKQKCLSPWAQLSITKGVKQLKTNVKTEQL